MAAHTPAPARQIIQENLDQVMRGDIKIGEASEGINEHNKVVCIMQATAYVLGYIKPNGDLTDGPVCTSAKIISLMITFNDHEKATSRTRKALVKVIPHIINTAPHRVTPDGRALRLSTPEYCQAENTRRAMIGTKAREWSEAKGHRYLAGGDASLLFTYRPSMKALTDFIIELANVAHFGQPT